MTSWKIFFSLSLSLLRAKWKEKEEFEEKGSYFNERRIVRYELNSRREICYWIIGEIGNFKNSYLSTSNSESIWIFIRSRDIVQGGIEELESKYYFSRPSFTRNHRKSLSIYNSRRDNNLIKMGSIEKKGKNLKNLEKILIQTRISIRTTFLYTRVME